MKRKGKTADRAEAARASLAPAFRVPRGKKKLFVIEAAVEVRSKAELERVTDAISRALCHVPPEVNHRCTRRWMVITHPADDSEVSGWEPILNDH